MEGRCVAVVNPEWRGQNHVERRRELRIGNPIGRQAQELDWEAERVQRQQDHAGMGQMRRDMLSVERGAMQAADCRGLR